MRAVKSHDTKPELLVRRAIHCMGYRYRLHRKDLPGKPDVVFPSRKKIIFVHGCFWHGHDCARGARMPKSNRSYWVSKISRNRERDAPVSNETRARRLERNDGLGMPDEEHECPGSANPKIPG